MKTRVRSHVTLAGEASAANVAPMWPDSGVDKPVFLQVRQLGERLGARFAPERSLARVSSQVHLYSKPNNNNSCNIGRENLIPMPEFGTV